MIMNYPEYNNVISRPECPRHATSAAFAGHDVLLPADCVFDSIGLSPMPDSKTVSDPMAESLGLLPTPMLRNEPARRSDKNPVEFFFLRS